MAGEQFQYQSPHRPVKGTIVRYQTFRGFRSAHGRVVVDARSFETRRSVARRMRLLFARKTVMDFTPAMMGAADVLIKRWSCLGDRATIDVAAQMARVTLDVVERTVRRECGE